MALGRWRLMDAVLHSSVKHDWQTPDAVLDLVRAVGPIVLDPCTAEENPVRAKHHYTEDLDGLLMPWSLVPGLVFVNPPYGRALPKWAHKACVEALLKGVEIITLTPARTDTRWFTSLVEGCTTVAFWRGRMTFKGAPAPAPFPTCLTYFGPNGTLFSDVFAPRAHIWKVR